MERSTPVPMGMGEQSLTPGEQRILALMEQGQQRILALMEQGQQRTEQRMEHMDKRLHSLEEGQQRTEQQLEELTLKVGEEAAASKMRDRKLAYELESLREAGHRQMLWLQGRIESSQRETQEVMHLELNSVRTLLSMRLDQHDTHLEVVKQTFEKHEVHLREHGQSIQGLQQETRKLTAAVEHLTQASRVAASP